LTMDRAPFLIGESKGKGRLMKGFICAAVLSIAHIGSAVAGGGGHQASAGGFSASSTGNTGSISIPGPGGGAVSVGGGLSPLVGNASSGETSAGPEAAAFGAAATDAASVGGFGIATAVGTGPNGTATTTTGDHGQ